MRNQGDWSWKPANFSTKPLAETQRKRADTFKSTKALRKHETMRPFPTYTFPVETAVRKRNGILNHQVSATFPNCGNTIFHPVYNHRISFHARRKLWAYECLHLCFQIWPNIHRHGLSQLARQVCQWRGQSQSGKTGPFYEKLRKQRPSVWLLCACPTRRALAGRAVTFE